MLRLGNTRFVTNHTVTSRSDVHLRVRNLQLLVRVRAPSHLLRRFKGGRGNFLTLLLLLNCTKPLCPDERALAGLNCRGLLVRTQRLHTVQ